MENTADRAIAIVGVGAILPDAPNSQVFLENVKGARSSIADVPPERWDPALYYDPDPRTPDKTYSRIGGWVRRFDWDPVKWKMAIPPRVGEAMDDAQKWAITCTREALADYGWPSRRLDEERTAVILGNAMGGERAYETAQRIQFPEILRQLEASPSFASVGADLRQAMTRELRASVGQHFPEITEDTMPGELSNCMAGRIANLFNFRGPNYTCDAACASAMAAMAAAVEGLIEGHYDAVLTGGVDRNMGASTFVKFCKIGALSATGTRPYADGADGFVMGEGAVVFLLKRLADAERDQDHVYAVLRGIGGASDGKGKGITAPNPVGQRLSIERAWRIAGLDPKTASLIEGHGTSTPVGDVVEFESLTTALGEGLAPHSVPLGSVKSNLGHLKGAAGAAGVLKAALALRHRILPPSLNFNAPNPNIDFARSPFFVNTELRDWARPEGGVRRAGVSAFGFGGTNFHVVLEEHVPGRLTRDGRDRVVVGSKLTNEPVAVSAGHAPSSQKAPLRGVLVLGASSEAELVGRVRRAEQEAPAIPRRPLESDLRAPERLALDYGSPGELADKLAKVLKAFDGGKAGSWKILRSQGVFRGRGPAPKTAFLFTGQGSQYVNMLRDLREREDVVREVFEEADRVMTPLLGRALCDYIFVDSRDEGAVARAEEDLKQTAITQPAVLATDVALCRLLAAYGIVPDMVMGHSLGEYGALVAAGVLPFGDALEAVSARGREMTRFAVGDHGRMAAVFAPIPKVEDLLAKIDGYVVIANYNCRSQVVIGGESGPVERALQACAKAGIHTAPLAVSHAFHTQIVGPASEPLRRVLERYHVASPRIPVVANVTGEFYPMDPLARPKVLDLLGQQVSAPVQFVRGLETLHAAGASLFVEVGPKRALQGFVDDVFDGNAQVSSLHTNHPKGGDVTTFNHALCGLFAAGLGSGEVPRPIEVAGRSTGVAAARPDPTPEVPAVKTTGGLTPDRYVELGRLFAEFLDRGLALHGGGGGAGRRVTEEPVVISGCGLGLPGLAQVFDDTNVGRILRGEQLIDVIPNRLRKGMADKHVVRLVKSEKGEHRFASIDSVADVIKLAARGGQLDLEKEFGVSPERVLALDTVTKLAIGAGLDALRDAGLPLVLRYKKTTKGTQLPDRWTLPEALRDDTGVICASAFPGLDSFADDLERYHVDRGRREQLTLLRDLRDRLAAGAAPNAVADLDRRIQELELLLEKEGFVFDRRFLFRILAMGHSQFAEHIGARGPNTHVNAACASTTQALSIAEDWIRTGRCRRVVVLSADDVTSDHLMEWIGSGFLASGAAATDELVEDAALPFDRRRHGMIVGMGAAALVLESAEAARERGVTPICEVLSSAIANSAYHGTRLNVGHITQVMEGLVAGAESRWGIRRQEIAPETVFVSHETYTPARGGSASAEVFALRTVFGDLADRIVMANTKGFTGHPMAVGIEDVVATKVLETGLVPPVANFREIDPELGPLNLSRGGSYPVRYALRLAAGFGSQISMTLLRWTPPPDGRRRPPEGLGYAYRVGDPATWKAWLARISGYDAAELEVVQRVLRVRDQGAPASRTTLAASAEAIPPKAEPRPAEPVLASVAPSVPAPEAARSSAVSPPDGDPVRERILALVSAKTGYPREMLALDLDLEADLGVDTVKQAELFTAVREEWGIPRDDNRKLRDYPTLNHVIGFVYQMRPDLTAAAPTAAPQAPTPAVAAATRATDGVREKILALVTEKTGYPPEMLDLDLDLEADLGVDTVKQAELFTAVREEWGIPRDDNRKLRDYPTLNHVIGFVYQMRPDLVPAAPTAAPPPPTPGAAAAVPASAPAPVAATAVDAVREKILALVTEKTGYPPEMLDLDLDLEADLGVDTVKQAELFTAVREEWGIPRDDNRKLRDYPTLNHVIGFVYQMRPDLVPAAPTAAAPPPAPVAEATAADAVREKILALVTEKTGYPPDMLDLDLDLEADLGVDTVKQAELFTAVREIWGIPRDDNRKLRDYPTLRHVLGFVHASRPDLAGTVAPGPVEKAASAGPGAPAVPAGLADLAAADRFPRRAVVPLVRPPLSLCKPTGVELGEKSRVLVMADRGGVGKALVRRLEKLGADVLAIEEPESAEALVARIGEWLARGPIQGVYWLPALDSEGDLAGLDLAAWREALRVRVKLLYSVMRSLYDHLAAPGTFLVSATRLGGQHGYDAAGALAPLGGAVTGFTKAYKRERPDVLVKAVDFELTRKTAELADVLLEETLRDPGAVEIGRQGSLRFTVGLVEEPAADGQEGLVLDEGSVFLVTGAAGSIVSAITADLAAASGGTFHLFDLVGEPDPANPDLGRLEVDREGLKRDIFERLKARGERATPVAVERELTGLERAAAALRAVEAVRAAGGTVHWYSCDLRNASAVAQACGLVRERSGKVDVLVHGAGLEISRMLTDKEPREFDLVFDVKVDGWFNVLSGLGDTPLGATVAFSSIAGRFGNGGQTDYSSANDLLCKTTSSFRRTRPGTRGIVIDWTAWGDIGMATRGSIPKMMEVAGIDMLPAASGIPTVRRELVAGGTRGEIVVAGRLGVMLKEFDETGGLDPAAMTTAGPLVGGVQGFTLYEGLRVETVLDPRRQPFLDHHRIDGTPVLPGVMGVEAFAETAALALPGWHVAAVEHVSFHAPFKFYRDEPRAVTVNALFRPEDGSVVADCRLTGARSLPGQAEPQITLHFAGRVRLVPTVVPGRQERVRPGRGESVLRPEDIYRVYFHGPAYQVLEGAWQTGGSAVGLFADGLPPNHEPSSSPTLMSPRLVELCFQTAGLLEMGQTGQLGLPLHVEGVRPVRPTDPQKQRLHAVVRQREGDRYDAWVVDEAGDVYLELVGYRTVQLPGTLDAERLEPFRLAMA